MAVPQLSICIPTYNFGQFIGETLASIERQYTREIEVIVLDGASTDNTTEVVAKFRASMPGLTYYRLDAKGGIDADMAKSVALAKAPYCWLFSADDVMELGALDRVLAELESQCDIYLCGLTICTIDMKPMHRHPVLSIAGDSEFELSDEKERHSYFRKAETSTAFFSYMSSLVIRRDRWEAATAPQEFTGSCWSHVARIFGIIPQGLRVRYLAESYLSNRSGNDSFLDRGIVNRIGIAVNGYWRLGDKYFGPTSEEARHIRRVVRNEYTLRHLLSAKWSTRASHLRAEEQALDVLVSKLYQDRTLKNRALHLAYRRTPLRLGRAIYRVLKYGKLSV
jgi:abequosyltransferase